MVLPGDTNQEGGVMDMTTRLRNACATCLTLPAPAISEFVCRLVEMTDDCGWITGEFRQPSAIWFTHGKDAREVEFASAHSRSFLRLMCARLYGMSAENNCACDTPYEGDFTATVTRANGEKMQVSVRFVNTASRQMFRISKLE